MPPMPKAATPVFEVATIHPADPDDKGQGFQTRGSHVRLRNESITSMIMFAYGIHKSQIAGPSWLSEAFNVDGIPDTPGEPDTRQMQHMVQGLLTSRFGLVFHREKRELSIYAITVAKGGAKLGPTSTPDSEISDQTGNGTATSMTMKFTNNSMDDLALGMQYFLDRPVVNQTALTGRFDFTLTWNPRQAPDTPSGAPGLFTAIHDQLGLRIEATKAPVDVLLIDKITHPTEN